jgi:hypothetical protein
MKVNGIEIDKFVQQYIETALWSSTADQFECEECGEKDYSPEYLPVENGPCYLCRSCGALLPQEGTPTPLDRDFGISDLSEDAIKRCIEDCDDFRKLCADDLSDIEDTQAAHDFWLTRNGHGAGFWDRGLGAVGDRLTANCKPYGEVNPYVGDDGKIHL